MRLSRLRRGVQVGEYSQVVVGRPVTRCSLQGLSTENQLCKLVQKQRCAG